jgi:hypothetical protein
MQDAEILENLLSENSSVDSIIIQRQNNFISGFLLCCIFILIGMIIYFILL